ncbi:hypothetical protein ACS8YF_18940 [Salinisphaera sp. SWV1]
MNKATCFLGVDVETDREGLEALRATDHRPALTQRTGLDTFQAVLAGTRRGTVDPALPECMRWVREARILPFVCDLAIGDVSMAAADGGMSGHGGRTGAR